MDTNVPPLLYEGSSRDVYRIEGGMLAFHFKDTFSVFDIGMHPQTIPGKAEALCECAVHSFKNAKAIGIETHFVEQTGPRSILVEEMATEAWEPDQPKGRLIPLEFITRFAVAGSLLRDFKKGKRNRPTTALPPMMSSPRKVRGFRGLSTRSRPSARTLTGRSPMRKRWRSVKSLRRSSSVSGA